MTRYLVKIYLNGSDEKMLSQAFDKEFNSYDEAEKYAQKYVDNANDNYGNIVGGDDYYSFELSVDKNELELCDFFEKCLKTAVNLTKDNPKLADVLYCHDSDPEEVMKAFDEYNEEEDDIC